MKRLDWLVGCGRHTHTHHVPIHTRTKASVRELANQKRHRQMAGGEAFWEGNENGRKKRNAEPAPKLSFGAVFSALFSLSLSSTLSGCSTTIPVALLFRLYSPADGRQIATLTPREFRFPFTG